MTCNNLTITLFTLFLHGTAKPVTVSDDLADEITTVCGMETTPTSVLE